MQTVWEQRYARRVGRIQGSAIRELLKVTELPGAISLAGGLPAAEIFPVEKIAAVTQRILEEHGQQALQYGMTEGYTPLRELLAQRLEQDGLNVSADNILITSGSQQGLDLLGKIMIDAGDYLLVESPTYLGALQSCNAYEPEYVAVRSDEEGIVTDELEPALQKNPKFIYALPNFQNPTGVTFTLERRRKLVEVFHASLVTDDFRTSPDTTRGSPRHFLDEGSAFPRERFRRGLATNAAALAGTPEHNLPSQSKTRRTVSRRKSTGSKKDDLRQKLEIASLGDGSNRRLSESPVC